MGVKIFGTDIGLRDVIPAIAPFGRLDGSSDETAELRGLRNDIRELRESRDTPSSSSSWEREVDPELIAEAREREAYLARIDREAAALEFENSRPQYRPSVQQEFETQLAINKRAAARAEAERLQANKNPVNVPAPVRTYNRDVEDTAAYIGLFSTLFLLSVAASMPRKSSRTNCDQAVTPDQNVRKAPATKPTNEGMSYIEFMMWLFAIGVPLVFLYSLLLLFAAFIGWFVAK